jgi:hypothetical protein
MLHRSLAERVAPLLLGVVASLLVPVTVVTHAAPNDLTPIRESTAARCRRRGEGSGLRSGATGAESPRRLLNGDL